MLKPIARGADSATPLYVQLANQLRHYIEAGNLVAGAAIPSERDLSGLMGASRVTVRKAVATLIEEGLLHRRQGAGTFLAPRIESHGDRLTGFSEDARQRGVAAGAIWLMKALANPTSDEAAALQIDSSTKVVRLGRVRLSDGEPLAIEHAIVPAHFLPPLAAIKDSLYAALRENNNQPVRGTQKIRAARATPTEAALLSIDADSELLRIERVTYRADGAPVEFTRSAYRGDRYEFVSDLTPAETRS